MTRGWDAWWEILEEEERIRNEWRIGQHPLLGIDEFMEDLFPPLQSLNEDEMYALINAYSHGISISEASVGFGTGNKVGRPEQEFSPLSIRDQMTAPIREQANAQNTDPTLGPSTSRAYTNVRTDEGNNSGSRLEHSNIQTGTLNCSRSEQVSTHNQTAARTIPRSNRNQNFSPVTSHSAPRGVNHRDTSALRGSNQNVHSDSVR